MTLRHARSLPERVVEIPPPAGPPVHLLGACGFGRCGSTMLMKMLHAGGVPPVPGTHPGTYERTAQPFALPDDALELNGRAVKLLDTVEPGTLATQAGDSPLRWGFLWLDREPIEQARSMVKFVNGLGLGPPIPDTAAWKFVRSFNSDRARKLAALSLYGPVKILSYDEVLADPQAAVVAIRHFLSQWSGRTLRTFDIDHQAAAQAHLRPGRCRRDLAVERMLSSRTWPELETQRISVEDELHRNGGHS